MGSLNDQESMEIRQLALRMVLRGVKFRTATNVWRRELLLAELAQAAFQRGYKRGMKARAALQMGVHRNTISRWLGARCERT